MIARRFGTALVLLTTLGALGACKREPSFDERYAGARKAIDEKAGELDQDMAQRASEAASDAPLAEQTDAAVARDGI